MYINIESAIQVRNKTKAKKISFGVHLAILLLALLPIVTPSKKPQDFQRAILINFEQDLTSSTKKSGSSKAAMKAPAARKKVEVNAIQKKQVQKNIPIPIPERKEIITMPEMEIPIPIVKETKTDQWEEPITETEVAEEVPELLPDPQPVEEFMEVTEEGQEEAEPEIDQTWADGLADFGDGDAESTKKSNGNSDLAKEAGDADGVGESGKGTGEGDTGKDTGEGNEGSGNFWGDFPGDGLFNRKVIERGKVGRLAVEKGKVVIDLCVDQGGVVTFVEYNQRKSSIVTPELIRKAEACAQSYVFEKDFTAPEEQCGKLTFIFKFENKE